MSNTPNLNLPMPDPAADVDDEFYRLQTALLLLDTIISALQTAVAGKAATSHTHTQAQVTGLVAALAAKMDASKTFKLTDLTDVIGASNAAVGYLLLKTATGFGFSSPAAALGNHQHGTADIVGLTDLIQSYVTALVNSSPAALDTLSELATAIGNDPNFAATMTNALAAKLSTSGGTMSGPIQLHNAGGTNRIKTGTGDGASYTTYNFAIGGWYGMGLIDETDQEVTGYYDFRTGTFDIKGAFRVNGNVVPHGGFKASSAEIEAGTANKFVDAEGLRARLMRKSSVTLSGAAVNLTGILSNTKRITLNWKGSFSAAATLAIRLGVASGIVTSGYDGRALGTNSGGSAAAVNDTALQCGQNNALVTAYRGRIIIERVGTSNEWIMIFHGDYSTGNTIISAYAYNALSGPLTQLQVTTVVGTATMSGSLDITEEY